MNRAQGMVSLINNIFFKVIILAKNLKHTRALLPQNRIQLKNNQIFPSSMLAGLHLFLSPSCSRQFSCGKFSAAAVAANHPPTAEEAQEEDASSNTHTQLRLSSAPPPPSPQLRDFGQVYI